MFDLNHFEKLKESNQLEVKQSIQGIPNSIWETYSAFCNSYGGTILLGVGEDKNKNLFTCGLNENQANNLLKSFWDTINNQTKVSINLLSDKDVQIKQIDNDYIVIINVPQSDKSFKPVYINNNPLFAYRRNHEGDYRCTKLEIQAMLRDQDEHSNDSQIIEDMNLSVLNPDTLAKYRTSYNQCHKEDHPFVQEDNESFLIHIGAAKKDNKYIINFNINSEAIITEYNCKKDLTDEKVIKKLEKDTEKKIKRYIKKSLNKQKETKGKFLGLERIIYLDYPKYKNEDYSVKYNVNVNLVRKGEIRNSVKGENNYE